MADYSILVVEDEHTLRRLLEYRLSKQYRVRTAANGEEALERVQDEAPDLIISDIMMPKMDGFALQQALQNHQSTRAIPFIFLTAKADEQSRLKGLRTGVDDYITKPFDIEQLLTRIERLLERTKLFQTQLDARLGQDFSQKLMPKRMPEVPGHRVLFYSSPREQGGGDLLDLYKVNDDVYFFAIGDVMGKGVHAKFYAFSFLSYVRGTLRAMLSPMTSPAELMKRLNQVLMQDEVLADTFASMLLVRWDVAAHRITCANAGHPRPVLSTGSRSAVVDASDLILGLDADALFHDIELDLDPGDAFVAYTDGIMEQRLANGEMVGESGVVKTVAAARTEASQPIQKMLDRILADSDDADFSDDVLVLWLQRET